ELANPSRHAGAFFERGEKLAVQLRQLFLDVLELPLVIAHRMHQTVRARMSACNPAALLEKYVEMLALRTLDAEGALADPKPRMRALAARFPGALREIDELPLETIHARIRSLEKTTKERGEPAEWMLAMAHFHDAMRDVLAIKRIVGRRKLTPALRKQAERIA